MKTHHAQDRYDNQKSTFDAPKKFRYVQPSFSYIPTLPT